MAFSLALAGKGGSGKTTLAALSIRYVAEELGRSVFGVDADPNASLGSALGVECAKTVADLREGIIEKKLDFPAGMSKERYVEYCVEECIVESHKFDLLVMGRPEGPKCYCYVNNILRKYLDTLGNSYSVVVMDNEAGMEHLSRRTTNNVDLLLVVCEPTIIGVLSAKRVMQIAEELPVLIRDKVLVVNRIPAGGISEKVKNSMEKEGLSPALMLNYDEEIFNASSHGFSLFDISKDNRVYKALGNFLRERVPVEVVS